MLDLIIDYFTHYVVLSLAYYNAGGNWVDTRQIVEYVQARSDAWAFSKIGN